MFARLFKTINLFRFVYRQTPQMPWTKVQILRTIEHDDEVKAKRSMYIAIVLSFKQNYFATVADKGNTYLIIIIGRSDSRVSSYYRVVSLNIYLYSILKNVFPPEGDSASWRI